MPLFAEDPACLSKTRLKSDLVAHSVALPPAKSKKQVYVDLHLKHVHQKTAADFSSDEEDQVQDVAVPDPRSLSDDDLKSVLLKHGVKAGPIVASTRAFYEKKLRKLFQSGHDRPNGAENGVLYSDSEEEEEEENGGEEDAESDSEGENQTVKKPKEYQQESNQVELHVKNGDFAYPQCFLPSSRLHVAASRNRKPEWNLGNALKSSERCESRCSQIPVGISKSSSIDQRSGLGSGAPSGSQSIKANVCSSSTTQTFSITEMVEEQMESRSSLAATICTDKELNGNNVQEHCVRSDRLDMPVVDEYNMKNQSLYYTPKASPHKLRMKLPQDPVKETLQNMFPDLETTPTGIYATRRRPIKGAAGRPVQYMYPDTPASPTTLQRREVERRLVPTHVQILVFLIVACFLYLIYVCVEDNSLSPFVALLESLNQGFDSEEGSLL